MKIVNIDKLKNKYMIVIIAFLTLCNVIITVALLTREQFNKNTIQILQRRINDKPWLSEQNNIIKYVQEQDKEIIRSVQTLTNELEKLKDNNHKFTKLVDNLQMELSLTNIRINNITNAITTNSSNK